MATFSSITLNGNVITEPVGKAIGENNYVWNFTMAKNGVDKKTKSKASIWYKVSYFASQDDQFMSKLKKGDCVVVSGDLPYMLDEYTVSYGQDKKGNYSLNLAIQAHGVGRGAFDSKPKVEGENSNFNKDSDDLVPSEGFSIPESKIEEKVGKF